MGLANDGELLLIEGDIGSLLKPLYTTLNEEGIEFTQETSANDVEWMFASLPSLQKHSRD